MWTQKPTLHSFLVCGVFDDCRCVLYISLLILFSVCRWILVAVELLLSGHWWPLFCSWLLWIQCFQITPIREIIWCLFLCTQFILLSMISYVFVHVVANDRIAFFSLLWLSNILFWKRSHCPQASNNWCSSHIVAIVNDRCSILKLPWARVKS